MMFIRKIGFFGLLFLLFGCGNEAIDGTPDLSVLVSLNRKNNELKLGTILHYQVTIFNRRDTPANKAILSVAMPVGVTQMSWKCNPYRTNVCSQNFGVGSISQLLLDLEPQGTLIVDVDITIPPTATCGQKLILQAQVEDGNLEEGPKKENNQFQHQLVMAPMELIRDPENFGIEPIRAPYFFADYQILINNISFCPNFGKGSVQVEILNHGALYEIEAKDWNCQKTERTAICEFIGVEPWKSPMKLRILVDRDLSVSELSVKATGFSEMKNQVAEKILTLPVIFESPDASGGGFRTCQLTNPVDFSFQNLICSFLFIWGVASLSFLSFRQRKRA